MALASMEGLILLALVVFAALCIAVMMLRLRCGGVPFRLPPWIAALVLAVIIGGLVLAIARGNWWNVATFTFATTTWTWILVRALRSRRSVG